MRAKAKTPERLAMERQVGVRIADLVEARRFEREHGLEPRSVCDECLSYVTEQGHGFYCSKWYPQTLAGGPD